MHAITGQHPQHTGHQACTQKFQAITQCECALALPQNSKQRTGVQLPFGKAAGRQGHGHGAQQGGQQSHQVQKLRGPVQGLAHLRAATVQRLHLHAPHLGLVGLGLRPGQKLAHGRIAAGHSHAPADAAGRLNQARRGQVGHVHHHARRKTHEARTPVGLSGDGGGNAQSALAQAQRLAHLHIQGFEQSRIDPDFALGRNAGRALAGDLQAATQGVSGLHGFEGHKAGSRWGSGWRVRWGGGIRRVHGTRHGRETHIGVALQTGILGLLNKGLRGALVTHHHRIAPQQLARITPQTRLHAIGQETHRRQGRHGQGHRHHQQAQLARPQVTPQLACAQLQTMHPRLIVHSLTITEGRRSGRAGGLTKEEQTTKTKKPAVVKLRALDLVVIGGFEPPTSAL